VIALDVAGGCLQARMTGELLDVSEASADLADFSRGSRPNFDHFLTEAAEKT
jgi:hypothetical protein